MFLIVHNLNNLIIPIHKIPESINESSAFGRISINTRRYTEISKEKKLEDAFSDNEVTEMYRKLFVEFLQKWPL